MIGAVALGYEAVSKMPGAAGERIVALVAREPVVPVSAGDQIVAVPTGDDAITLLAPKSLSSPSMPMRTFLSSLPESVSPWAPPWRKPPEAAERVRAGRAGPAPRSQGSPSRYPRRSRRSPRRSSHRRRRAVVAQLALDEVVVAAFAEHGVVAAARQHQVVPVPGADQVVLCETVGSLVVAGARRDDVAPGRAREIVVPTRPDECPIRPAQVARAGVPLGGPTKGDGPDVPTRAARPRYASTWRPRAPCSSVRGGQWTEPARPGGPCAPRSGLAHSRRTARADPRPRPPSTPPWRTQALSIRAASTTPFASRVRSSVPQRATSYKGHNAPRATAGKEARLRNQGCQRSAGTALRWATASCVSFPRETCATGRSQPLLTCRSCAAHVEDALTLAFASRKHSTIEDLSATAGKLQDSAPV